MFDSQVTAQLLSPIAALGLRDRMMTMANISSYVEAVERNTGLIATWTPDKQLRLGDIVTGGRSGSIEVEDNLFDRFAERTDIKQLQIQDTAAASVRFDHDVRYEVAAKAAVDPVGTAEISFQGREAFVLAATDGTASSFRAMDPLRRALLHLVEERLWRLEWNVVTEVRRYRASTLVLSRSNGARASVAVTPGAPVGLDAIQVGATFSTVSGQILQWPATDATPFYKAVQYKPPSYWNGTPGIFRLETLESRDEEGRLEFASAASLGVPEEVDLDALARVMDG